jgi:hypothetical protein
MTKTKTGMAAALALGVATLFLSPAARAMPVDGLAATAISDGIQNVRWVCGPYRCWWRPSYYAHAPGYYYGPRRFYGFGYRRWGW